MPADHLTPEAAHENATALAMALGIHLEDAAQALNLTILITADSEDTVAASIAREVASLLSRTVQHVSMADVPEPVTAELVIGARAPRTTGSRIYARVSSKRAVIGREDQDSTTCEPVPAILRTLIACYASAATLHHALGAAAPFGVSDPLIIEFSELGVDLASLAQPIDLGRAYLAGAGAIGNGLLWAGRHLDLRGELHVVDDDHVAPGNLNRQVWFTVEDVRKPKADTLVARAQPFFPKLTLRPRRYRLQDVPEKSDGAWLERLIVAVDSRRARRALQNEFPGEVFDASTTDIREVVVHYNRQPTLAACLSCIYEPDEDEFSRERHIAEHLGVPIEAVRSERISAECAHIIAQRFPALTSTELTGTAYDSLFKRLCGEGALQTLAGKRVVAPFAFVSVLAGALLALELVRRLANRTAVNDNYWRISPWHSPLARRRVHRPKQSSCPFCGNPVLQRVNESIWRGAAAMR